MSGFKDKLFDALHSAVSHYNEVQDPNAAVVKAAGDHDFNVDQTQRLLEAFNTARTVYHYKSASDRCQEFSLAEPDKVIPELYSVTEQNNSTPVSKAAGWDYGDYGIPEAHYEQGLDVSKAAATRELDTPEPTEFLDTDLDTQAKRACDVMRVQRDLAETCRGEANIQGNLAGRALQKVASGLSQGWEEDCRDRYSRLAAGYAEKEAFRPVMDKLAEFMPAWLKVEVKSASDLVDDRDLLTDIDLLKSAQVHMEEEAVMLAMAGQLDKEADAFEAEFVGALAPVLPEKPAEDMSNFLNPALLKAAAGPDKITTKLTDQPNLFGTELMDVSRSTEVGGPMLSDKTKDRLLEPAIPAAISALSGDRIKEKENKDLSERLKNTQRQIMLEDLLANDPVLSEEDPQTVAQAYRTVLELSPQLASNKEVVRAILRQSVHSLAVDPYTAESWTKVEKNLRALSKPHVNPKDLENK